MSRFSHTADFLEKEILEVIENIGPQKISAIVSDAAAALVLAKKKITEKYPHIISIRCIAHHINLITTDIGQMYQSHKVFQKITSSW